MALAIKKLAVEFQIIVAVDLVAKGCIEAGVVVFSVDVFCIVIYKFIIVIGLISADAGLKAKLFIGYIYFIIDAIGIETAVIDTELVGEFIAKIQFIVQVDASTNGTAPV